MKNMLASFIMFCLILGHIQAQPSLKPDSLHLAAMDKLSFLEGEWTGTGWMQMGRDKHYFTQKETVLRKVNNSVYVIDGLGIDNESNQIIHQAFAIISYDRVNQKYLMRAIKGDGNYIDADAYVADDGSFIWGFKHPQAGQIKYTTRLENGKWVERGESTRDNITWYPFIEMTLSKN